MTRNVPAQHLRTFIAVLLAVAAGAESVAEPENDAQETGELCQRVFEAIAEPRITFGLQGHELRPSAHAALDRIINFARNCPHGTIVVIGHSDSIGDERFNLAISRLRAQSVAGYLRRGGVPEDRLNVESRGSSEPVADNDTRSGRAKNRRIELKLETRAGGD